ncbi:MAG: sulfatase-like hydrolase/transferase [Gemmatimonadota bacterium]
MAIRWTLRLPFRTDRGKLWAALAAVLGLALVRRLVGAADAAEAIREALVDACILIGMALACAGAQGAGRRGDLRALLFAAVLGGYASVVFWHAYFFGIAAADRFSVLGLSLGTVAFFVRHLVPLRAWPLFVGFWALVLFAGMSARSTGRSVPRSWHPRGRGVALVGLGVIGAWAAVERHPLAVALEDARWVPARASSAEGRVYDTDALAPGLPERMAGPGPFKRVLVFVMEGVDLSSFEAARVRLDPARSFFARVEPFATRYRGYFTVDQESRTARIAMLHGRMVPYEAYDAAWSEHFGHLLRQASLVERLQAAGWKAALATPLAELPWDLRAPAWDRTVGADASDLQRSDVVCLEPTRFDRGCEDRVLLDRLGAILAGPESWFLFQPFLFGHTDAWEARTGIERVRYYDQYLAEILDRLGAEGGLRETLIVVTADHGPRRPEALQHRDAYEVPLWFVHPGFPSEERMGHFASTELGALLAEALESGRPPAARHRPLLMAMGPTTRSLFMCARSDQEFAVLQMSRNERVQVITASGADGGFAVDCARTFFDYRAGFDKDRDGIDF